MNVDTYLYILPVQFYTRTQIKNTSTYKNITNTHRSKSINFKRSPELCGGAGRGARTPSLPARDPSCQITFIYAVF